MNKGVHIAYAISKEVCRDSFYEWLKTWEIKREDFDKFIQSGVAAFSEEESDSDSNGCKNNN